MRSAATGSGRGGRAVQGMGVWEEGAFIMEGEGAYVMTMRRDNALEAAVVFEGMPFANRNESVMYWNSKRINASRIGMNDKEDFKMKIAWFRETLKQSAQYDSNNIQ